jgi:hypothetical protein
MGHLVTYIEGEYDNAKLWYATKGKHHSCFFYPSNLYRELSKIEKSTGTNILIGNSADPSNNHFEVFGMLEVSKDQDIKIYTPLSYGNQGYAKQVINEGKKRFGAKFVPLTEHLPFDVYLELLGKIDIAIFNHQRQQAMGNIRILLGYGKKVFMNQKLTSAQSLKKDGIKTFCLDNISLNTEFEESKSNIELVKKIYSEERLSKDWREIFSEEEDGR